MARGSRNQRLLLAIKWSAILPPASLISDCTRCVREESRNCSDGLLSSLWLYEYVPHALCYRLRLAEHINGNKINSATGATGSHPVDRTLVTIKKSMLFGLNIFTFASVAIYAPSSVFIPETRTSITRQSNLASISSPFYYAIAIHKPV